MYNYADRVAGEPPARLHSNEWGGHEPNRCRFCCRCRGCQEYHAGVANTTTVSGKVILVIPVAQDVDGRWPQKSNLALSLSPANPSLDGECRA
jgi:hypothetical protein